MKQTEPFPVLLRRNAITRRLTEVTILPQDNEYLVRLRSTDGSVFELVATFDQLDELSETIDQQLDDNED